MVGRSVGMTDEILQKELIESSGTASIRQQTQWQMRAPLLLAVHKWVARLCLAATVSQGYRAPLCGRGGHIWCSGRRGTTDRCFDLDESIAIHNLQARRFDGIGRQRSTESASKKKSDSTSMGRVFSIASSATRTCRGSHRQSCARVPLRAYVANAYNPSLFIWPYAARSTHRRLAVLCDRRLLSGRTIRQSESPYLIPIHV